MLINKIIIYHGTTENAGKEILKEGKIVGSNPDQVRVKNTERGYVFFSDSLGTALHYGSFKQSFNNECDPIPFYVFKLIMDKDDLLEDCYETNHMKSFTANFKPNFYKIKGDVTLSDYECKYAEIKIVGDIDSSNKVVNTITKINSAYFHFDDNTLYREAKNFVNGNNLIWNDYQDK